MRAACAALGKDRHKMTVIVDLKGYNMRLASPSTLAVLHKRTRLEEDHYPEARSVIETNLGNPHPHQHTLTVNFDTPQPPPAIRTTSPQQPKQVVKRLFLINTPALFASAWGVVAYFMDEGTRNKVQLLGADFLPTVARFVDEKNLPVFLGGALADCRGDAECRSIVASGGLVPLAFLVGVAGDGLGAGEEVAIAAGKSSDFTLRVPAGCEVAWHFGTAEKDISFSASAVRCARGAAVPAGVVDVGFAAASVYGAHRCAASVSGASLAWPGAAAMSASAPGADAAFARGEAVTVVPPIKLERLSGAWDVPAAAAGEGEYYFVRLSFSNAHSWMTSKRLVRRVDVLVGARGKGGAGVSIAEDLDDELATERTMHRARIAEWVSAAR